MTRAEALRVLERRYDIEGYIENDELAEAIDIAINVIQTELDAEENE